MKTETVHKRFAACSGRHATHDDCTQTYLGHKSVENPEASYFAEDRMIQVEVRYVCNCFCGHRHSVQAELIPAPPESEETETDPRDNPEMDAWYAQHQPRQRSLF